MKKFLLVAGTVALIGGFGCGGGGGGPVVNPPTANFTFTWADTVVVNGKIDPLEVVTFTDASTAVLPATVTGWSWTFAGGTPATASTQVPGPVTFATAGFHDVSLTVTDSDGKTNTYTHAISVNDSSDTVRPDIDVTKVVLKGTATDAVGVTVLTDDASGAPVTVPGFVAGTTVNFSTHDITMGTGTHGDSTKTVHINAADAAANSTPVTVTITEDELP